MGINYFTNTYCSSFAFMKEGELMNFARKIKRNKEKEKLEEIKNTYDKKPKDKCPKCGQKSLFMSNKDGDIYCIRCDSLVKTGNK